MAEKIVLADLIVNSEGASTEPARKQLEKLKLEMLQTEDAYKKLKKEVATGNKSFEEAARPLSDYELKMKALRTSLLATQNATLQIPSFTQKINKGFADGIAPLTGFLSKLGPIGSSLSQLVGKTSEISSALGKMGAAGKSSGDGLDSLGKMSKNAATSAAGATQGIAGMIGGISGVAGVAGIAAAAIAAFGKELFDTAKHLEEVQRKGEIVFGNSFPAIQKAAEETANSLGITTSEYIALAAAQSQTLQGLGFTAEATAALTPELLELSDGLSDLSAGAVSVEQSAEILQQAIAGNVKGLAQFNIPIKRSKEELEALSAEIYKTGLFTKDQADAMASLQIVTDQVGDSIEKLGNKEKSLADKTDEANAKLRQAKEDLATALTPAFNAVTNKVADYIDALVDLGDTTISTSERLRDMFTVITGFKPSTFGIGPSQEELDAIDKATAAKKKETEAHIDANNQKEKSDVELYQRLQDLKKRQEEAATAGLNGVATRNDPEIALIEQAIKKRAEEREGTDDLGRTYEQLQATLTRLADTRKTLNEKDSAGIAANDKETAAIKERIKVFEDASKKEKKTLTDLEQAAKKYAESKASIANQLEIGNAKINDAAAKGFIDEQTRQRMLLDMEVATASARLNAKEQFASADGRITEQEKANIVALAAELNKAKKLVEDYAKSINEGLKDRTQKIKVELDLQDLQLDKELADLVATDKLDAEFNRVFEQVSNNFGEGMRAELLAAAKDGSISFDGLTANIDTTVNNKGVDKQKKAIEDLRIAYEAYALSVKKNEIEFISKKNQDELEEARKKLRETREELAKLQDKNGEKVKLGIDIPAEDLAKEQELKSDVDDLTSEVHTVSIKVASDTTALSGVQSQISALPTTTGGDGDRKPTGNIFGMTDEEVDTAIDDAENTVAAISEVYLEGQRQLIEARQAAEISAAQAQYDAQLNGLQAMLESGQITQAQYDQRSEQALKDSEARKDKARKEAFEKDKKLKRADAVITYAIEIANLAAAYAKYAPEGLALFAIQSGLATVRLGGTLAAINGATFEDGGVVSHAQGGPTATRIKSVRGTALVNLRGVQLPDDLEHEIENTPKRDLSGGAVLEGASHAEGGIKARVAKNELIELEGDEIIINKKSAAIPEFRRTLSYINSFNGNGRAFEKGGEVSRTPKGSSFAAAIDPLVRHGAHYNTSTTNTTSNKYERGGVVYNNSSRSFSMGGAVSSNRSSLFTQLIAGDSVSSTSSSLSSPSYSSSRTYAHGGPVFSISSKKFSVGGAVTTTHFVPRVFAEGGSLVPAENTVANRRQLEAATAVRESPIVLNNDRDQRPMEIGLAKLERAGAERQRQQDRVTIAK